MINRRHLLALFAQGAAAATMLSAVPASAAPSTGFIFLYAAEIAFLEAAVERIIPTDEQGMGARDAGVVTFIDRALAGAYGSNAREYMSGPYGPSTAHQGYQLPLTNAEIYRIAIAATDRFCEAKWSLTFAALTAGQQDQVLRDLESLPGLADGGNLPARLFFQTLLRDTRDGFFADPAYGGNKDFVGWKLIGYPGAGKVFIDEVFQWNKPYPVDPAGLSEHQHNMGMTR